MVPDSIVYHPVVSWFVTKTTLPSHNVTLLFLQLDKAMTDCLHKLIATLDGWVLWLLGTTFGG
jgi:hypothetical protein